MDGSRNEPMGRPGTCRKQTRSQRYSTHRADAHDRAGDVGDEYRGMQRTEWFGREVETPGIDLNMFAARLVPATRKR